VHERFKLGRENSENLELKIENFSMEGGSAGGQLEKFCYRDGIKGKKWIKCSIDSLCYLWGSPENPGQIHYRQNDPPMIIVAWQTEDACSK